MGKDLKGKELGNGICQRKNGKYCGRYVDRFGQRKSIYDDKLSELRKKLAVAIADNQLFTNIRDNIKLDDWFNRWMEVYKKKISSDVLLRPESLFRKIQIPIR